jgi:gliding motility-associated-like protein
MKAAYVLILLSFCRVLCFSQTGAQHDSGYFEMMNAKASKRPSVALQNNFLPPSSKSHLSADSLKGIIKRFVNKNNPGIPSSFNLPGSPQSGNTCLDTSFVKLLNTYASQLFVAKVTPLADGNMLISAEFYDTMRPNYSWRSFPLLIKIDEMGNAIWLKQFDNTDPVTISTFYMYNAFELSNHDIICAASIDTTNGNEDANTILYRLDQNGNILWQTGLHTNITNLYPGLFDIKIQSVAEGLSGDLILCALCNSSNSAGKYETIIRVDKNGNVIWDANYGNDGDYNLGAEGVAVYMDNGNITEVGISHGSVNLFVPSAITVLKLDYNTGNLISKRFFKPNYLNDNDAFRESFTYYFNQCTRLTNGHYIVSGKLFSDFENITALIDHFGLVEFDAGFNLIKAYTISSPVQTDYWDDNFYIAPDGKGLLQILESNNYPAIEMYLGSFQYQQFFHQREVDLNNIATSGFAGWEYTKDSGYVYIHNYFNTNNESAISFRKMHNSDTSSECLGKRVNIFRFLPLNYIEDPLYYNLDANKPNQIINVHYNLSQNDTLQMLSVNPCKQVNYCDTIKVHGVTFICGDAPVVIFTAYKNPACGGIVQWSVDSTAIDSMQVLTDTSVMVYFKNINWKGYVAASLPAGSCLVRATDSLPVTVTRLQNPINLGPDTILCAGNTLTLHAGNTFVNYKWQDGSTDSVFTVTSAGTYFVSAKDLCGNLISDTILVHAASFAFNVGNDTAKCNNDSITLTATAGFINYTWRPSYGINADTGRTIHVSPAHDTSYIAVAEKVPGCFVSDTVHIAVYASPVIHLGNDTSFCSGQSLLLNAGSGFQNYLWNTGEATQKITATQKGIYIVKATAANGCISKDTLQVLNISSLPQFTLGIDTALCNGSVYTFHFALANASYLWNDGSTAQDYAITLPGAYWLHVTQQGCTAGDTVLINYKNNPQVYLGDDTTVCAGNTVLLHAAYNNASYLWQDGSAQPDLLVTNAGVYYVTVDLAGCTAKDTIQITYLDKPFFTLGGDTVLCQGTAITLHPRLNVPAAYLWQDGSTQSSYTIKDTGTYKLTVTNTCGSSTDDISIAPGLCNIMLPNAFTPNGDGFNDLFRVKYPFLVKSFLFTIFDRFGQKIFETTAMNKGWDGSYKGIAQPLGTYVWTMQVVDTKNASQSYNGIVTLIR